MNKSDQQEFLKGFFANPDWKREVKALDHLLGQPVWWQVDGRLEKAHLKPSRKASSCEELKHGRFKAASCYRDLLRWLKEAGSTHRVERFLCHRGLHGLACPISKDDEPVGLVGLCHIQTPLAELKDITALLAGLISSVAHAIQKEMELADLYKTLKPRAIALSTAHTVHRIMTSTLNMDELLPRIARLTLQVLRAKRCSIMLLDRSKRTLIPKAGIGLKDRAIGRYKLPLGRSIPGKVAKTGDFYRSRSCLSVPLIEEETIGVITVWEKEGEKPFVSTDEEILTVLAEQAVVAIRNAQLYEEQQKLTMGSIKSLAAVLDLRAPYKYTPSPAFIHIALACGKELSLSEEELTSLRYATLLHDAGKVSISERILTKPSGLTDKEYEAIKKHPYKGVKIIEPIDVLKPTMPIILYHHEKYDGSGYPEGLKKEEIPIGARIMAVADAFWAMTSKRPYRKEVSIQQAAAEIKKYSGTQFDPKVVEAFLKVVKQPQIRALLAGKRR